MIKNLVPLWSEIRSLLESIYGRATIVLSLLSPAIYLFDIPEQFIPATRIIAVGALFVIAANILFTFSVPSVQRDYPKFLDYENKCLKLVAEEALDIYEEFGQIVGRQINPIDWDRTGHSFPYLSGKTQMPLLDEYKTNFQKGQNNEGGCGKINRVTLARSLTTIKYVIYDTSHCLVRAVISITLLTGIAMMYGSQCMNILHWIF